MSMRVIHLISQVLALLLPSLGRFGFFFSLVLLLHFVHLMCQNQTEEADAWGPKTGGFPRSPRVELLCGWTRGNPREGPS